MIHSNTWNYLTLLTYVCKSYLSKAKAGRPARTYIQQLCEDTGCNPEDLPEAMNDREKWWEMVKDIRASGTTWWWYMYKLDSALNKLQWLICHKTKPNHLIIPVFIFTISVLNSSIKDLNVFQEFLSNTNKLQAIKSGSWFLLFNGISTFMGYLRPNLSSVSTKVGDCCWERPEGSLFNSYFTEMLGRVLLLSLDWLLHFTLDKCLILLSVKQGGIKYHF